MGEGVLEGNDLLSDGVEAPENIGIWTVLDPFEDHKEDVGPPEAPGALVLLSGGL